MAKQIYSRAFKLAVVERIAAGEAVSALSRELGVKSRCLYRWVHRFRAGGAAALRSDGRPTRVEAASMYLGTAFRAVPTGMPAADPGDERELARIRIAALERKIGRQELELDFFREALRHVEKARSSSGVPGGTRSTRSSRR